MSNAARAARAYQSSAGNRSLRQQEADVFLRATGGLRAAMAGSELDRVRAVSDNRRLWLTVLGLVQDPNNALPLPIRAAILSVGRSVQRVMDASAPDFAFLIAVNENVVAGLTLAS